MRRDSAVTIRSQWRAVTRCRAIRCSGRLPASGCNLNVKDTSGIYADNSGYVREAVGGPTGGRWHILVEEPGEYEFVRTIAPDQVGLLRRALGLDGGDDVKSVLADRFARPGASPGLSDPDHAPARARATRAAQAHYLDPRI